LPGDDADLETLYIPQDYLDVDANDATRVPVQAEGETEYIIHQFKDYVGGAPSCTLYWDGQSDQAPSASIVNLEIYNYNSTTWENVDSDNVTGAGADFVLQGSIPDLTNYRSPGNYITCRVWQRD
jgi:hypothetical protein